MTADISDGTLTAYLDGELPEGERRRIAEALAVDERLRARLEALDIPVGDLRLAFDTVLEMAPPPPRLPSAPPLRKFVSPALAASLLVAGMLIGGVWSPWQGGQDGREDWKQAIADYQVLYVPETLAGRAPAPERIEARLDALAESLGRDLAAAGSVEGLHYRRAQMLGLNARPLVQIAYLSEAGVPFAICVTPVEGQSYAPESGMLSGLAASHWVEDGFGFLVIGGVDSDLVERVAADLRARI